MSRPRRRCWTGIERLTRGRTTIIITHGLSTIRNCDLILVPRDGIIAERGTFTELMHCNGVFADLYNTQFRDREKKPAQRRVRRCTGRAGSWELGSFRGYRSRLLS